MVRASPDSCGFCVVEVPHRIPFSAAASQLFSEFANSAVNLGASGGSDSPDGWFPGNRATSCASAKLPSRAFQGQAANFSSCEKCRPPESRCQPLIVLGPTTSAQGGISSTRRNTRRDPPQHRSTEIPFVAVRPLFKHPEAIMKTLCSTLTMALLTAGSVQAHGTITVDGDQRCITSDGVPDHETGPWRAGATVEEQNHRFCMDATPELAGTISRRARISGITVTGIPMRPGTAEYYDPSSARGYSRDPSSGWNVEGVGGLIMDAQNAHVDGDGMYHYHGIPSAVTRALDGTLFGYAADGFEIHYAGAQAQSSWQLKSGERESGPGGTHDGTYEQDYEFVAGSGTLDECNGTMIGGKYVYFATDTYPFFPRCFKGTVSSDFIGGRGDRPPRDGDRPPRGDDG